MQNNGFVEAQVVLKLFQKEKAMQIYRSKRLSLVIVLTIINLLASLAANPNAPGHKVTILRLGSNTDATPALNGPSYFFQGNGAPSPSAFQDHINQLVSAPLDIVVLAASLPSGSSQTPECDELIGLGNVNSCTTITLTRSSDANNANVVNLVNQAETVYFAGGNQCNYVSWKGSGVYNAVKNVVARGGGTGGGSAGLAIQGDYVYDSCTGSVLSSEALSNPYHRYISFTYDFFKWNNFGLTITDTHFQQRDRMGRLMVFVARQIQDGKASTAYGVGVNEGVSVVMDKNGLAQAYGGSFYVVLGDHVPEQCASRKALTFSNFKIWEVTAGSTFDFAHRPTTGYYLRSVTNGVISSDPY
jgi:cyanophycinase-like exopeptidase